MSQPTIEETSMENCCIRSDRGSEFPDQVKYNGSATAEVSCSYCGEDDPHSLVMCTACSRWFCNGEYGTSGSHVVLHLVKSKHRAVKLHAENALGDFTLECYCCRSTNIFSLGFIPSKEESVVVLVCRELCLHSKTLRDLNWDASTWLPLIEERRILSCICKVPTVPRKKLTMHDIITFELAWNNVEKDVVDTEQKLLPIPICFNDAEEYQAMFSKLVARNSIDAEKREERLFEDVSCKWQKSQWKRHCFLLKDLPPSDEGLHCGEAGLLSAKGSLLSLKGVVIDVNKSPSGQEEVVFEAMAGKLQQEKKALDELLIASKATLHIQYNSTSDKRMMDALKQMVVRRASLSAYLYFTILGQKEEAEKRYVELDINLPSERIPGLNSSQDGAVRKSLKTPLTLIQGPPGTGKTTTIVAIVRELSQRISEQILLCAPSNVAVDHLAERISAAGLKTVRLQAFYRDVIPAAVKNLGLEAQVQDFIRTSSGNKTLKRIVNSMSAGETLSGKEYEFYYESVGSIEKELLCSADVICCTCIGAGDRRLENMCFKYVLIDEVTQGTEPETLVPLVHGAKQIILVGDHCQLRPIVLSASARNSGLRQSLFERLLKMGHRPVRLDVQYRMHPALSLFPSDQFYEGSLQNGVTEEQRDASSAFPWPDPTRPIFFYNTTGSEELGTNGNTYVNRTEAALTEQIITQLIQKGKVKPEGIGVITPYRGQCQYVMNYLLHCGPLPRETYGRVEVSSVDSFQGREKEYIILSCVRSNHRQGIGFVVDWRRLNVSITRAKRGLIILGNVQLLSRYDVWHSLLTQLMGLSLVVDGPIQKLVPSKVVLQKPRITSEEE